jgi:hypothetical protein
METVQRKIAICGMAPSSRDEIPVADESWEIWGLNVLYHYLPRWDRWYECHDFEWLRLRPGLKQGEESYLDWLQQDHGRPIFMPRPEARFPSSVQYPLKEVVDTFGRWLPNGKAVWYCQSTIDWMLCHALWELLQQRQAFGQIAQMGEAAIKHTGGGWYVLPDGRKYKGKDAAIVGTQAGFQALIGIYGIDLAMSEEYHHQRPSMEHWVGQLLGQGFQVYVPERCDILQCPFIYGLDSYEPVQKKYEQRKRELDQRLQMAATNEARARDEKMAIRGAIDDLNWIQQQRY